jgi:heme exporter protein B
VSPVATYLRREIALNMRSGGAGLALSFFVLTMALLPLSLGSDPGPLRQLGASFIWITALLAQLLTLERLVQSDLEDGSLDILLLSNLPAEVGLLVKALAHWLSIALPLTLLASLSALLTGLSLHASGLLVLSLLIGLPGLSALGTTISALTAGVRRGALLLSLLVLPLAVPFVIFGAAAAKGEGLPSFLFLGSVSVLSFALTLLLGPGALRSQAD